MPGNRVQPRIPRLHSVLCENLPALRKSACKNLRKSARKLRTRFLGETLLELEDDDRVFPEGRSGGGTLAFDPAVAVHLDAKLVSEQKRQKLTLR